MKALFVLQALIKSFEDSPFARGSVAKVNWDPYPLHPEQGDRLAQDYLWNVSYKECIV
jgi:hypothetical protein